MILLQSAYYKIHTGNLCLSACLKLNNRLLLKRCSNLVNYIVLY